eukprot:g2696.t1
MKSAFEDTERFNVDTSKWDVTNVNTLESAFQGTERFNVDTSKWDVSKVTSLKAAFAGSKDFGSRISTWNVAKVATMESAFEDTERSNVDISKWDVSKVTSLKAAFAGSKDFNSQISKWNVGKVETLESTFNGALSFNVDISKWDVGKVTTLKNVLRGANNFKHDISESWDVRSVSEWYNGSCPSACMTCEGERHSIFVKASSCNSSSSGGGGGGGHADSCAHCVSFSCCANGNSCPTPDIVDKNALKNVYSNDEMLTLTLDIQGHIDQVSVTVAGRPSQYNFSGKNKLDVALPTFKNVSCKEKETVCGYKELSVTFGNTSSSCQAVHFTFPRMIFYMQPPSCVPANLLVDSSICLDIETAAKCPFEETCEPCPEGCFCAGAQHSRGHFAGSLGGV